MELFLKRAYFPEGANGGVFYGGKFICFTIELPWKDNKRNVSCIPEGRYRLIKRFTSRRGWHLMVKDVPGRSGILFHPANNALRELRGCIAPVCLLSAPGVGMNSRKASERFEKLVFGNLREDENVYLTIQKAAI